MSSPDGATGVADYFGYGKGRLVGTTAQAEQLDMVDDTAESNPLLVVEHGDTARERGQPQHKSLTYGRAATIALVISGALLLICAGSAATSGGQHLDFKTLLMRAGFGGSLTPLDTSTFRDICDADYVRDTCIRWNEEGRNPMGTSLDNDISLVVYANELHEYFMTGLETILKVLYDLGVTNIEPDITRGFAVSCMALCEKTVAAWKIKFGKHTMPAKSDVACVYADGGLFGMTRTIKCDTDTRAATLNMTFHSLFQSKQFIEPDYSAITDSAVDKTISTLVTIADVDKHPGDNPETVQQFTSAVYYPEKQRRTLMEAILNAFHIFPATHADFDSSTNAGQDQRHLIFDHTRTLELAQQAKSIIATAQKKLASRQIPDVVSRWYGSNDDATRAEIKRVLNGLNDMLSNVRYVYPGSYCNSYSPHTLLAYVEPSGGTGHAKDEEGRYILNLCDSYVMGSDTVKLEALLEEGSHHLQMDLKNEKYAPVAGTEVLYGRNWTRRTAKACCEGSSSACVAALRNAENFCYFVTDAHAAPMPVPTDDAAIPVPSIDCANLGPRAALLAKAAASKKAKEIEQTARNRIEKALNQGTLPH